MADRDHDRTRKDTDELLYSGLGVHIHPICNMVSINLLSKRIFTHSFFVCFADLSDIRSLFPLGGPPVKPAHSDVLRGIDACVGQLQVGVFLYLCLDICKYCIYI